MATITVAHNMVGPRLAFWHDDFPKWPEIPQFFIYSLWPNSINVQFYSIGTGIDHATYLKVLEFFGEEVKAGNLREFHLGSWGLEGEKDLCVVINPMNNPSHIFELQKKVLTLIDGAEHTDAHFSLGCSVRNEH